MEKACGLTQGLISLNDPLVLALLASKLSPLSQERYLSLRLEIGRLGNNFRTLRCIGNRH